MARFGASIEIAATPERVYEVVSDLARHGQWSADELEVESLDADRFRSRARSKGKLIEAELQVLERGPSRRFVFEARDLTGRWVHEFTLTPVGERTRVEREISGELSGSQLLLFWLVLLPIKKPSARRSLGRLKALVEAGS